MHSRICTVGGFGRAPEATLFLRAQMGCRASLNTLMARHDGLVHAVVRRQVAEVHRQPRAPLAPPDL